MGAENERPPTFIEWVLALLEDAFHGWVQDEMSRSAERTRSMNSPTCTSR